MLNSSAADRSWGKRSGEKSEKKNFIESGIIEEIKKKIFTNPEKIKELILSRPNWDEYFMTLAKIAATRSTCISRPTGAVIVKDKQAIATGYNGSMPGVAHCSDEGSCFRRRSGAADAGKYDNCRSIHAEANAIAHAAKRGINIKGSTIYVTLASCYVCTKLLASAGIVKMYYEFEYKSPDAKRDILWAEAFEKVGIETKKIELSDQTKLITLMNLLSGTSWRRDLKATGEPTGRIENIKIEEYQSQNGNELKLPDPEELKVEEKQATKKVKPRW